jgi:hypothetical protein
VSSSSVAEHHARHHEHAAGDRDDLSQSPKTGIAEYVLRDIAAEPALG